MSAFDLQLFASDVDGTLLTFDHQITPEVRAAVTQARAAGVHIVLASARSPQALAILQDELGIRGEPLVGLQGAWVGSVPADGVPVALASHPIPADIARSLTSLCAQFDTPMSWFGENAWYYTQEAPVVQYEARVTGIPPVGPLDVDEALAAGGPLKIMVPPNPDQPDVGARIVAALPPGVHGQLTGENYLEITVHEADKSHGIALIAQQLGVKAEHIAAAGDGPNDIGMFALAAKSYAMGNASAVVQAAASEITATNADSGLAHAILDALGHSSDAAGS